MDSVDGGMLFDGGEIKKLLWKGAKIVREKEHQSQSIRNFARMNCRNLIGGGVLNK